MDRLLGELEELRDDDTVLPANEFDLIIGGDLNASIFDGKREDFFEKLDEGIWDVLAEEPYPPTNLAGNPLEPRSQIDYLIASRVSDSQNGLVGEEISENVVKVHHELAGDDEEWVQFRQPFSDHMPVTTCLGVILLQNSGCEHLGATSESKSPRLRINIAKWGDRANQSCPRAVRKKFCNRIGVKADGD